MSVPFHNIITDGNSASGFYRLWNATPHGAAVQLTVGFTIPCEHLDNNRGLMRFHAMAVVFC